MRFRKGFNQWIDIISLEVFDLASRFLRRRLKRTDRGFSVNNIAADFIVVPRGMKYRIIEGKWKSGPGDPLNVVDTIGVRFIE